MVTENSSLQPSWTGVWVTWRSTTWLWSEVKLFRGTSPSPVGSGANSSPLASELLEMENPHNWGRGVWDKGEQSFVLDTGLWGGVNQKTYNWHSSTGPTAKGKEVWWGKETFPSSVRETQLECGGMGAKADSSLHTKASLCLLPWCAVKSKANELQLEGQLEANNERCLIVPALALAAASHYQPQLSLVTRVTETSNTEPWHCEVFPFPVYIFSQQPCTVSIYFHFEDEKTEGQRG